MTPVIIVALGLLGTIVMGSILALLLIFCMKQKCGKMDLTSGLAKTKFQNQGTELVRASWNKSHNESGLVGFSPEDDLPEMFLDPDWNGDAENLISHCIDLLKSCHILTARLVAYTMENTCMIKSPRDMTNIVAAAKHIQPRVDELVIAMYTPSDSKQIEERSTALYKSVCHLLQTIQSASSRPDTLGWADEIIVAIERHMEALQNGGHSTCSSSLSIQSSTSSESCLCQQPTVVITNQAFSYPHNTTTSAF